MILPTTYIAALLLSLVSMICWGSWANTFKLTKKWRFELFYFDYTFGVLLVALIAAWTLRTIKRERSVRVGAERAAVQSHRLAQTNAAFGHAGTSTEAISTAIHEPLHWLRAGSGVFFLSALPVLNDSFASSSCFIIFCRRCFLVANLVGGSTPSK